MVEKKWASVTLRDGNWLTALEAFLFSSSVERDKPVMLLGEFNLFSPTLNLLKRITTGNIIMKIVNAWETF